MIPTTRRRRNVVPLVECVPNFSDGRRPDVLAAIVGAMAAVVGVHILDQSSDHDHNRSVVTLVGAPDAVGEAAFRGIERAAALIDLEQHVGQHPRIGAADVVPLIPLRDISLNDCVALARRLGERVGRELGLPVYLYEQAATRPERRNLANVRRGGYEGLKATIGQDAARQPDYGPTRLTRAGAVAIGARGPLIAFNAYLDSGDVAVAQAIALKVRESGGGLHFLKALGLLVDGRAQVSMNVIDYRQTGLLPILRAVEAEASQHGAVVTHTELIGLVPQTAFIDAALSALKLPAAARDLILEQRIGTAIGDYRPLMFDKSLFE